jgi:rsbT co-antagonist protein RsbR
MKLGVENLDPALINTVFAQVALGAPIVISVYNTEGRFLLQIGKGLEKLGLGQNQLMGTSVFDAFAGADEALSQIRNALAGVSSSNTQDLGASIWDNWFSPLRNAAGDIVGAVSISTDVTDRERSRVELAKRVEEIESQASAMRTMAFPIIQVWEGVVVVPVVGELDSDRAAHIMERLLSMLTTTRSRHAILDLTGVEMIDSSTADQFVKIVSAVGLLGVNGIISGIRPAVAQALVGIGVDLGRITTVTTLHDGLRRCIDAKE